MNGTPENDKNGLGDSASNVSLHAAPDDHSRSEEVERLISTIREEIRSRDLSRDGVSPEDAAADYQFGQRLDFGVGAIGLRHFGSGWHVSEPGFTWSEALYAYLNFNLPMSSDDLVLEFTANGYTNSKIRFQSVIIEINGMEICRIPVAEKYTFTFLVPKSVLSPKRQLVLKFGCENRASPSHFRRGTDHRLLGIALHSLIIRKYQVQGSLGESNLEIRNRSIGKGR